MLPPIDIDHVALESRRLCEDLTESYADAGSGDDSSAVPDPADLCAALQRVLAALAGLGSRLPRHSPVPGQSPEADPVGGAPDLGALSNYAIDLLARMAGLAGRLHLPQQARKLEALALPLAVWVARRGGELANLAPVVNAAGALANSFKAPDDLAALHGLMSEVIDALSPHLAQDDDATDATRPWRVLLLNRAIVATRSHRPDLMEAAFSAIAEALPGDAPDFFREALGQMEALDYPPQVRRVVQRYADTWCTRRTLH